MIPTITDPKLYAYGVENPMSAIENLTATTLRNIIGDMELDQSLTSRDTIKELCRNIVTRQEVCDKIREVRITEGMNGYGRKNQNDASITQ